VVELRKAIESAAAELQEIIPKVRPTLEKSQFGADALQKAERALQRGTTATQGIDREALESAQQELDRALNLFRGLANRKPGSA
jgi:hypothetical protein